jgi:hypothetical protein
MKSSAQVGQMLHSLKGAMERTIQIFQSFDGADEADEAYYAGLLPQERLDILLNLITNYQESLGETATRLERVCQVVDLARS